MYQSIIQFMCNTELAKSNTIPRAQLSTYNPYNPEIIHIVAAASSNLTQLIGFREYFIFNNSNIAFSDTPTEFPPAITVSPLAIP